MSAVIFKTENAVFKFDQKQMKELIARKKSEYDRDELAKLLRVISNKSNETILNPEDHYYFGFVVLDLISAGMGKVTCNICGKLYGSGQLDRKTFDINQEQKGGYPSIRKEKNSINVWRKGI